MAPSNAYSMQAALPCLLMAQQVSSPSEAMPDGQTSVLDLRGGTDASMAPPAAYAHQVLLPMLQRLQGVQASIDLQKRGFFPKVGLHASYTCLADDSLMAVGQADHEKHVDMVDVSLASS